MSAQPTNLTFKTVSRPNRHGLGASAIETRLCIAQASALFAQHQLGYRECSMARLPSSKQAASGVGFLGGAAVLTMHKAVHIAERARHKPDKAAHEVRYDTQIDVVQAH